LPPFRGRVVPAALIGAVSGSRTELEKRLLADLDEYVRHNHYRFMGDSWKRAIERTIGRREE